MGQTIDFTATPTSGCSPLPVIFTNTSTGFSSAATYSWDFGNGNTSTLPDNAGAQYKDEHDYTVTLTITDDGKTYTKSTTVTVYKKPLVDFMVNTTGGCSPLPVSFTSSSSPGDGTITGYLWDFGDGATQESLQEVQHVYQTAASISPSLTVTNSYGCYSTLKKNDLIQVLPSVTPVFAAVQTTLCKVNDAVTFINNSTGPGTLNYLWDFGDGKTSAGKMPVHQYTQKGAYTIKLHVTNSYGCAADTIVPAYINVANYNSDFDVPTPVCENTDVTFTDKSTPQPTAYTTQQWIANGTVYPANSNQFTYNFTAGQHSVQLVNEFGTCKDTVIKSFTVLPKPQTNGFVAALQTHCGAPVMVQFNDTTKGAVKWEWDVDNTENGNFIPTYFSSSTTYTYNANGTYYVWLRTTNAAGCSAEVVQPLNIQKASASINSSSGEYGCDTLRTIFSAMSSAVLKQTEWDFGDGTPVSNDKTPEHIFTQPGKYQVVLHFETADGCTGVAYYQIDVNIRPKFDFTAVPGTTVCGSTPVGFTVSGTNLDGNYFWSFGDPPAYYPGSTNVSHQYQYDSIFTVSLIISKQGCSDTLTKINYITVLPPFPRIASQTNTCDGSRGLVTFKDSTTKATNWSWNFGDGTPVYAYNILQPVIQHNYTKTGSYTVVLTTKKGSCTVTDSSITHVLLKQSPQLSASIKELCGSDILPVVVSDVETNPAALYYNSYHDYELYEAQYRDSSFFAGSYTSPDITWRNRFHLDLTNLDDSKKDIRFITTSYYFNCLDTTNFIPLKINGPTAGFTVQNKTTCYKQPFTFTDTSNGGNGAAVVTWEWSFGDGSTAAKINSNPFNYQYQNPGTYDVILKITDENGCTDTAQQNNIAANGPKAAFDVSANPVMRYTDIFFYNQSVVSDSNYYNNLFTWTFGDGKQQQHLYIDSIPAHNYAATGVDTAFLIAKNDSTQCADTAIQLIYIKNINLNFNYTTEFVNAGSGCPPVLAKFTNLSVSATSISWNFGDGNTAGNTGFVTHIYNIPGRYKVTLYGYFNDNTVDSVFENIVIKGPYATLKADKQFACGAQPITLYAKSSSSASYTWDFGDGTLTGAADTFAIHRYLTPGTYTPSLIVRDSNNCSFPFFIDKPIIIDTLHLAIYTQPAIACDSSKTFFVPQVVSLAKDSLHAALQYHWTFGTGKAADTASSEAPSFIYNKTGTYTVRFSAASPYGCVAQTNTSVVVNPTPIASIKGPAALCQGDSANFAGLADVHSNTMTWKWHFPNGNTPEEQHPLQQHFSEPGTDSVSLIINNNGCFDTAYSPLTVYAKPVIDISPVLPQICVGQAIGLEAHDGTRYSWSPDNNISSSTVASPLVSPDRTTTYKVAVTNSFGCINTDSVLVKVVQHFKVNTAPLLYICRGSAGQLNAAGADIYKWIAGDNLSDADIPNPVINTTTPQAYIVVGYDSSHCFTDTADTEVRIAELPTVKAGSNLSAFAGTPVTLTAAASNDVTVWNWQPAAYLSCTNCPTPVSTPQMDMVYTVQVKNEYGCMATDSLRISILCKESLVQIPSAFTPNGDGRNERFSIMGNGIKQINRFAVFSRSGELLFERSNMTVDTGNAGWDGTFNGKPVSPGTYVYIAEIVCSTGAIYQYKGTVVLIR